MKWIRRLIYKFNYKRTRPRNLVVDEKGRFTTKTRFSSAESSVYFIREIWDIDKDGIWYSTVSDVIIEFIDNSALSPYDFL